MQKFQDRIVQLKETSSNIEVKEVCNSILEMQSYVPEGTLRNIFLEKIQKVQEKLGASDTRAIKVEEKIDLLNNLGLSELLESLKASPLYKHQSFGYAMGPLIQTMQAGQTPAYLIAEKVVHTLTPFKYDPTIAAARTKVQELLEANAEDILIAKGIYEMERSPAREMYKPFVEKLASYIFERASVDRLNMISHLGRQANDPICKSLVEGLQWFQRKEGKTFEVVGNNRNFAISPIYSYVHESEDGVRYFNTGADYYKIEGDSISPVTNEELGELPQDYVQVSAYLGSRNVSLSESGITIFVGGKHKVEFITENGEKRATLNGRDVTPQDIQAHFMNTGIFGSQNIAELNMVNSVWENLDNVFHIDYAKKVKSRIYEGVEATIFRINGNLSTRIVNNGMQVNEWFTGVNGNQLRNKMLEHMGFDLSESLSEYLEGEQRVISQLEEARQTVAHNAVVWNEKLEYLRTKRNDVLVGSQNESLDTLEAEIESEIAACHEDYARISAELEKVTKIQESKKNEEDGKEEEEVEEGKDSTEEVKEDDEEETSEANADGSDFAPFLTVLGAQDQKELAASMDASYRDRPSSAATFQAISTFIEKNKGFVADDAVDPVTGKEGKVYKVGNNKVFYTSDKKGEPLYVGTKDSIAAIAKMGLKLTEGENDTTNEDVSAMTHVDKFKKASLNKKDDAPIADAEVVSFVKLMQSAGFHDNGFVKPKEFHALWAAFFGDREMKDPASGENILKKSYPKLVGKAMNEGYDTNPRDDDGYVLYESGEEVVLLNKVDVGDKVGTVGKIVEYNAEDDVYRVELEEGEEIDLSVYSVRSLWESKKGKNEGDDEEEEKDSEEEVEMVNDDSDEEEVKEGDEESTDEDDEVDEGSQSQDDSAKKKWLKGTFVAALRKHGETDERIKEMMKDLIPKHWSAADIKAVFEADEEGEMEVKVELEEDEAEDQKKTDA